MAEKRLAMITARGGSKRIPRKNIKEFCGKPILFYSIEAAIKSEVFDEVMVSTDSEEIAENKKELKEQRKSAHESHEKLWNKNKEQDGRLNDHETRIKILENT